MAEAPAASVRRWTAAQIGAREHYSIPLLLDRYEQLRAFFTDAWCHRGRRLLAALPFHATQALAGRYHPDLPDDLVHSYTATAVLRGMRRSAAPPAAAGTYDSYLAVGGWFGERVASHLKRMDFDPERDAFFAFNTGALEALRVLRDRGVFTVVDQIDPGRVHRQIVDEQLARWQGWERPHDAVPEAYWERLRTEWSTADRVLVNSEWSRQALLQQGVPAEKLVVVPVAYEPVAALSGRRFTDGPLRVLWLGSVSVAKGIPYLLEAAALLRNEPVRFEVVGPIQLTQHALASAPSNVHFHGPIPRAQARLFYERAHVFVLPTLSDGFAITQLEAMSHGVPVIATPRCGDVVTSGVDGLLVPPGKSAELASAILHLAQDRSALAEMSRNAVARAQDFRPAVFAERLAFALRSRAGREDGPARPHGSTCPPRDARRWLVSQIGARQHYAIPIALHERGSLRHFFTDGWCSVGRSVLRRIPGRAAALAARFSPRLPPELVTSFTFRTVLGELRSPSHRRKSVAEEYRRHLRDGVRFGELVAAELATLPLDPRRDAFFGFTTGSLEAIELLKRRGIFTLVDQIDAARLQEEVVRAERRKYPGWEEDMDPVPKAYWDRLAAEWYAADAVLVNSDWSKSALLREDVPERKIVVVPLAYDAEVAPVRRPRPRAGPLTVLWLGTVNLCKGIPYLLEAARLLEAAAVQFVVVGPIRISMDAVRSAPANVRFVGRVQRAHAEAWYRAADVFVHPTLSDGFGITQLEAMAHGLPVVTTPRCGKVVTPGVDGLVVPPADAGALAEALAGLLAGESLVAEMSRCAVETARSFTRAMYAKRLDNELALLFRG